MAVELRLTPDGVADGERADTTRSIGGTFGLVRIGTWNMDRERGSKADMTARTALIKDLRLDVLVITEPGPTWSRRGDVVVSPPLLLDRALPESWIAIRSPGATTALALPYGRLAAVAHTTVEDRTADA